MSFKVNWNSLETEPLTNWTKELLTSALNSEKEVCNYSQDEFITPNFLLSNEQFAIPLDLKLSDIKINGIGIIVFSKSKGLTLVFRNDPLDSIKVSSTFDTVQVLANFLQKQIENQIRDLFRETLDNNINEIKSKLSQQDSVSMTNNELASSLKLFDDEENEFPLIYSSKNLQKNMQLFKSRETFRLSVPKFKNIVQRTLSHDDKQHYGKTDNLLKDISSIQANNFYKYSNKDAPNKPKRRRIKVHKKSKAKQDDNTVKASELQNVDSTFMESRSISPQETIDTTSTLIESAQ
ncbi:hypothetical protein FOB64_006124 [Candida albicans]|uniref:SMP-LTD domain-containing protein n=1 Tax=Candida albicans TaxID=5476 RepID=A0A8H6BT20_CANAX|nr:hypothetical protein FOB64_006124 [Candida albicans]